MENKFLKITAVSVMCMCVFIGIAKANEEGFANNFATSLLEAAQAQAKLYRPVWNKMLTCTPGRTADGALIIFGMSQNNRCHFKYSKYNCRVPLGTTKNYAMAAIKSLDEIANGNFSTSTPENDYMERIHNNPEYCIEK